MDKKTIIKKYKFQDVKELDKYLKWCRSKGWKPGCGVECQKTCKYHLNRNESIDRFCNYILDEGHRRPCPPWDCTVCKEGTRRRKSI